MLEDLGQDPHQAAAKAEAVGARILAALSEPYSLAGYQHYSTCSIGITSFNQTLDNIGDLLKQADLAMATALAVCCSAPRRLHWRAGTTRCRPPTAAPGATVG